MEYQKQISRHFEALFEQSNSKKLSKDIFMSSAQKIPEIRLPQIIDLIQKKIRFRDPRNSPFSIEIYEYNASLDDLKWRLNDCPSVSSEFLTDLISLLKY